MTESLLATVLTALGAVAVYLVVKWRQWWREFRWCRDAIPPDEVGFYDER
jgi:hypothetical protein